MCKWSNTSKLAGIRSTLTACLCVSRRRGARRPRRDAWPGTPSRRAGGPRGRARGLRAGRRHSARRRPRHGAAARARPRPRVGRVRCEHSVHDHGAADCSGRRDVERSRQVVVSRWADVVNGLSEIEQLDLVARFIQLMSGGSAEEFEELVHPDAVNREAASEPAATRGRGPAAFSDLSVAPFCVRRCLGGTCTPRRPDGDTVAVHTTMHGRHARPFVLYGPDGWPGPGLPADRSNVRGGTDPLVQGPGWTGDRALGGPRRSGPGPAARVGSPKPSFLLGMRRALHRARRMHRLDQGAKVGT